MLISCVLTCQHLQKSKNDFHSRRSELVEDASVTAIAEDPLENLGKCHMTWSQLPSGLDYECDLWYLQVKRRYSGTRSARSWLPWVSSSPPCSPVTRSGGAFRGRGSKTPGSEHFPAFDFVSRFRFFENLTTQARQRCACIKKPLPRLSLLSNVKASEVSISYHVQNDQGLNTAIPTADSVYQINL